MRGNILNVFMAPSFARILGAVLGFATAFFSSVLLGAKDAGQLYVSIACALGIAILARWGVIDRILVEQSPLIGGWRAAVFPAHINRDLLKGLLRALIWLCLFLVMYMFGYASSLSLPLLFALTPSIVILQIICAAAKAAGYVTQALIYEFVLPPALMALTIGLCILGLLKPNISILGGSYFAGTVAGAAGCFFWILRPFWNMRIARFKESRSQKKVHDYAITEIANYANSWFAILLLPIFSSMHDVGIFNLIYRLSSAINLMVSVAYSIILPKISVYRAKRERHLWDEILQKSRIYMVLLGIAFSCIILVSGSSILRAAGEDFAHGLSGLYIMSFCFSLSMIGVVSSWALLAAGYTYVSRNLNLSFAAFSMILSISFIYSFGLLGASIATGIGSLLLRMSFVLFDRKIQKSLDWGKSR